MLYLLKKPSWRLNSIMFILLSFLKLSVNNVFINNISYLYSTFKLLKSYSINIIAHNYKFPTTFTLFKHIFRFKSRWGSVKCCTLSRIFAWWLARYHAGAVKGRARRNGLCNIKAFSPLFKREKTDENWCVRSSNVDERNGFKRAIHSKWLYTRRVSRFHARKYKTGKTVDTFAL